MASRIPLVIAAGRFQQQQAADTLSVPGPYSTPSYYEVGEIATPATPAAGFGRIYAKTDGKLYFLNDGGTEVDLSAAGTPAGANTQIQFNSAGVFGASASLTWDGTTFVADGAATFNDSGADRDFRVEGDTRPNLFLIDGGQDRVGINRAATTLGSTLDIDNLAVAESIFIARDNGTTVFTIADGGVVSIGIDGTVALPALTFGATADPNTGFTHLAADTLALVTGGSERWTANTTEIVFNTGLNNFDFRVVSDTDANALFLDASLSSGRGRWGFFDATPDAQVDIEGGTLTTLVPAFGITGTMVNPGGSSQERLSDIVATSAGAGNSLQTAQRTQLTSGYTGSSRSSGGERWNSAAGTGTAPTGVNLTGNFGGLDLCQAVGAGHNLGTMGYATSSTVRNTGLIGFAIAGFTAAGAEAAIGIMGRAQRDSGTGARVGALATLAASDATIGTMTDAGLIADNGAIAAPIFLARDANTTVFSVGDGGIVTGNVALGATADLIWHGDTVSNIFVVDVSADFVGFSTATPVSGLDVQTSQGLKRTPVADVNYTVLDTDYLAAYTSITAARVVSLPTAVGRAGRIVWVKDESGAASVVNTITIDPSGAQTIDGAATIAIVTPYGRASLYSDGANWFTMTLAL